MVDDGFPLGGLMVADNRTQKPEPTDPAFPTPNHRYEGLSRREYMATAIMAGLAADNTLAASEDREHGESIPDYAAKVAVQWADALIAALNA